MVVSPWSQVNSSRLLSWQKYYWKAYFLSSQNAAQN
jgi:hypothetical protein